MVVRLLQPEDARRYTALRREMLADSPWAFGASPEQDRGSDAAGVARSLADSAEYAIAGALADLESDGPLLAAAGILRDAALKRRHVATVWGVYVTPGARGRGLGRAVVQRVIAQARSWPGVERVHLSVSENSPEAHALYQSLGFVAWGIEPDCLRVGEASFAEVHMSLRL